MNQVWRHMAASVFEQTEVSEISLEEIDRSISRYPYFSVLHYLRTGKMMAEGHPDAKISAERAALYFPNPHWLDLQLQKSDEEVDHEYHSTPLSDILSTPMEVDVYDEGGNPVSAAEFGETEELTYDEKRVYEEVTRDSEDLKGEDEPEKGASTEEVAEHITIASTAPDDETAPTLERQEQAQVMEDEVVPMLEKEELSEVMEDEVVPMLEKGDLPERMENEEVPLPGKEELPEVANLQAPVPEQASTVEDPVIPIEPLHTVDYFASQGIRLSAEEVPGDNLSMKLKSFTEWLKAMKRLHPAKIDKQMDQATEQHIRQAAEHSNEQQEVYTEALAEVYLKQGLRDKAAEVFQKLSLLDPSKSAYFAARIREINEN